jgi:serine/threonine protein kinase
MTETLTALAAAHARGVLHRDIKPSNILLQQDGHTKISDFGIAKSFDLRTDAAWLQEDATITGVVLGTPGYLAPERRSGELATVQSDLYSVGAVMVETLTGQRLGPAGVPAETLPPPLREVAACALAPDPSHRFASANDMLQAVQAAATGAPRGTRPQSHSGPAAATVPVPVRPSRPVQTAALAAGTVPAGTAPAGTAPAGTAHLSPPNLVGPRDPRARTRRRRLVVSTVALLALACALFLLLAVRSQPTRPAAAHTTHHRARPQTQSVTRPTTTPTTDPVSSAIAALATSLAQGGFPGDAALASALQAIADEAGGADRQSMAQQALALAGVLLDGGGITSGQYQDVLNVLQPTGATVTTVPTSTAPTPPTHQGHGHDHGPGGSAGGQG